MLSSWDELVQFKRHQWNYFNFEGPCTTTMLKGGIQGWKKWLVNHIPTSWDHWCLQEGRSEHKDENADAVSWSTAGPKMKTGEAKGETNPEFVCSIQFGSNVSEWLLIEAMKYNKGLRDTFVTLLDYIVCHSLCCWFDLKTYKLISSWSRENWSRESWSQETKSQVQFCPCSPFITPGWND